ncbi:MAG: efflux transporter outer membrane subunit [Bacteroidales bacterium]|jgi:multidrug efflux system outer membrane protein|nr:efflux transporter outer membrane subunit [Bacteroidales bacterium]
MKRTLFIITIIGLIVYLAGCKVGPNYEQPILDNPEAFRFDNDLTDTIVNLKWWDLFEDPVLDTLIEIALEENKDVLQAAARVEAARANVGYTRADALPTINAVAGASYGNYSGLKSAEAKGNFYAFPELVWEIDFWGKYRRSTEAARAQLLSTEYGMRQTQISLISSVVSTYFMLLDDMSKLEISQRTYASRDSGTQIIQSRYDYGVVPEIDLNQAQIQQAIAAASVPVYKRYIAYDQSTLSILLGRSPDSILVGSHLYDQKYPPEIPTGLPSQLLARRPDILSAEADYMEQNALIGVAVAMRFPAISLTGLIGGASTELSSFTTGGFAWSVGGSLLGPLFQFGKNKRRVEQQRYLAEAARLNYESVVLQAFKDVEDALITIETLREELRAQEMRMNAAQNAEMLSQERYDKGVTSYLEVLESQRQSFDAQLSYSTVRRDLFIAYIDLYKALGGGWVSEAEMQAAETAEEK